MNKQVDFYQKINEAYSKGIANPANAKAIEYIKTIPDKSFETKVNNKNQTKEAAELVL